MITNDARALNASHYRKTIVETIVAWLLTRGLQATLLVAAGVLKIYQLSVDPDFRLPLVSSRSLIMCLAELEIALGLWLLTNVATRTAKAAAVFFFLALSGANALQIILGIKRCGCFGVFYVNPAYMLALDLVAVMGLLAWRPAQLALLPKLKYAVISFFLLIGTYVTLHALLINKDFTHFDLDGDSENRVTDPVSFDLAISYLLNRVGLTEPDTIRSEIGRGQDIDVLQASLIRILQNSGVKLKSMDINEALPKLSTDFESTITPLVAIHKSGFASIYLGQMKADNRRWVNLSTSARSTIGYDPYSLKKAGYTKAWLLDIPNVHQAPVTLIVGKSKLMVSKLWHSFGQLQPRSKPSTNIILSNLGPDDIILDSPFVTSCGCLSQAVVSVPTLAAGQTFPLKMMLSVGDEVSNSQWMRLRAKCPGDKDFTEALIRVFAFQAFSYRVTPSQIDFGASYSGQTIERQIVIDYSNKDMDILDVKSDLGNVSVVSKVRNPHKYTVKIRYNPEASDNYGRHTGLLSIRTTAKTQNRIDIPLSMVHKHPVNVTPEALSFGSFDFQGPVPSRSLQFSCPRGIKIQSIGLVSSGFKLIEEVDKESKYTVLVSPLPRSYGLFNEDIAFRVTANGKAFFLRVPSTGEAR